MNWNPFDREEDASEEVDAENDSDIFDVTLDEE